MARFRGDSQPAALYTGRIAVKLESETIFDAEDRFESVSPPF